MTFGALTANAQGFIDLQARLASQKYEQVASKVQMRRGQATDEKFLMKLFVTCSKNANALNVAKAAKEIGAQVRLVEGSLIALEIPYWQLDALAGIEGVAMVSMPPKAYNKTDVVRQVTQADQVNEGAAPQLPQAYTGKGVIVGIIDGGFDFTHPMFKDKDGNLRIKGFYEPGNSTFGGDSVIVYYNDGTTTTLSGSAYSNPQDLLNPMKVLDYDGSHGTHCASVAAGSVMTDVLGTAGKPLGGIAPEADILVCNNYHSGSGNAAWDLVESLYYLGNEAELQDKPLVVSLSQNSQQGWHDGTSTMAQYLGWMSNEAGVALMLCSSNEGGYQTYINEKVNASDTLRIIPYSSYTDNYVWGGLKTAGNVKMEVGIVNLNDGQEYYRMPMTFNSAGQTLDDLGFWFNFADESQALSPEAAAAKAEFAKFMTGGDLEIYCYQAMAVDQTGNPYIYTQVYIYQTATQWLYTADAAGNYIQWGFNIYLIPDQDTELHAWADLKMNLMAQRADGTWVAGTGDCSIGDWNTSGNPVSIGAWAANDIMQLEDGQSMSTGFLVGDVAFFSSYVTDLAGHTYPDACAPGTNVVAAYSSFDPTIDYLPVYQRKSYDNQFIGQTGSRDYFWGTGNGTSTSTSAAAGVVALWMQAANDMGRRLSCNDIKDILAHSCDTDDYTAASPDRFGYGKINAYKGLLYVLDLETSIPTLSMEQPANVTFRVEDNLLYADGAQDGTPVTIYNLKGVSVSETTVHNGTISIAGLSEGVYAVQLGKSGSTLIRK